MADTDIGCLDICIPRHFRQRFSLPMNSIHDVSNILAIRLSGIGDVILMMPALAALKCAFPDSRLTLMTGSQCVSIAELCPYIDRVVPVDRKALKTKPKLKAVGEIYHLIRELRAEDFDLVVDFHSLRETNLMARLSGARYRVGLKRSQRAYLSFCFNLEPAVQDEALHMAATFRALAQNIVGVLPDTGAGLPLIEVGPAAKAVAARFEGPGPRVALNVGASRAPRRWSAARFSQVASYAVDRLGASVLVIGGVADEEASLAREVQAGSKNPDRVHLANGLSFPELAALIGSVDLLVSNDTGPMHIGPALGIPTIGIFAGGSPHHYRPAGPLDQCVQGKSMEDIEVESVIAAMDRIWHQLEPV